MATAPPMDVEEYFRVKLTMPANTVAEIAEAMHITLEEAMHYENELEYITAGLHREFLGLGGRKSRRYSKKSGRKSRKSRKSRRHSKKSSKRSCRR
jgi:hypothetical protein